MADTQGEKRVVSQIDPKKDFHLDVPHQRELFHVKGADNADWGMKSRLSQIFDRKSGNTLMLAFDHGYITGASQGLERLDILLPQLIEDIDVLMANRGALRTCVPASYKKGVALRCSVSTTVLSDDVTTENIGVDIDDAIRAGILREVDLPASTHAMLGPDHSSRIETLVLDMVETSAAVDDIRMSDAVWNAMMELRSFLFERVYSAPAVTDEVAKATHLVDDLFDYYVAHTGEVPQEYRAISEGDDLRAVTDFIAGMTDRYAKNLYQRLFIPNALHY